MKENATYRLALAHGFLREAQEDLNLRRWRSAVSNTQLSVENGLKAVISLFLPVAKTHDPARILLELIAREQIPAQWQSVVQNLAEMAAPLGPQLHVQTDYGDEYSGRLPWELFDEEDANEMFAIAQDIINRVDLLVAEVNRE